MEVELTKDGSSTIYWKERNEHYHSSYGAIQESRIVYIEAGLNYFVDLVKKDKYFLFEMGFGTGLNALLTCLESEKHQAIIYYTSVEAYPLDDELLKLLNYNQLISKKFFEKIHKANWEEYIEIHPKFYLKKIRNKIQNMSLDKQAYDIIYYDAFAPEIQPKLWEASIFEKLYEAMINGQNSVLVSYCAKGVFKRVLKTCGFKIEGLAGPEGKREITRAIK